MIIIGITGTLGAGKGTVVDYLVKEKGFRHFSVREYLINKLKEEGKEINRDTMVEIANKLRAENSPSYLAEELFKEAQKSKTDCVIESLRTEGEISELRKRGHFYLIAVDADPKKRFDRIKIRDGETDHINYNRFILDELREMGSKDPNKQNLGRCMKLADYKIRNDGDIESLYKKISETLNEIQSGGKERKR